MKEEPVCWFPARRYGIGWNMFATWQGCLVFGVECLLICVGIAAFPRGEETWLAIYEGAVVFGMFAICYVKGEPLIWRWGGRGRD